MTYLIKKTIYYSWVDIDTYKNYKRDLWEDGRGDGLGKRMKRTVA